MNNNEFYNLETMPLRCPECGQMSDSIKSYNLPSTWVSLVVYLSYGYEGAVCCPSCMRKKILMRGFTYNIVTANVYWPFTILPWSVINLCRSYTKGHSSDVVELLQKQINGQQ